MGKMEKINKQYSEVYEEKKTALTNKIILGPSTPHMRHCTFRPHTLQPIQIRIVLILSEEAASRGYEWWKLDYRNFGKS